MQLQSILTCRACGRQTVEVTPLDPASSSTTALPAEHGSCLRNTAKAEARVTAVCSALRVKVPSLRNVAMTPPYFHDGSVRTLPKAVRIMAKVQLGKNLSDGDVADIVVFLNSLTGKLPENFIEAPVLPPSGFDPTAGDSNQQ